MDLKLKVLVGNSSGEEIKVTGPKFFVGRSEDCQLRPRSDLISRHHCVIVVEEKLVAIRDFGSKNGTYVNNERVAAERELKSGDILKIGPLEFECVITESAPAKKRPPVQSVKEVAARAASSSTEFEMDSDISKWLEAGPKPAPGKESITRELSSGSTAEIQLSEAETTMMKKASEAEAAKKSEAPKSEESSKAESKPVEVAAGPAKLPPRANPKDSFNAAADALKKLRKR